MNVERIGKHRAFVPSLIGLAMLAIPSATWSQQQGQGQGQEDVQVAVAPSEAQQPQQQMIWNEVRVVHVKPDRAGEFEGLIKELAAVMSEQGEPGFSVWQVAFGPQSTYHIVAQLESFASIAGMEQNPPMEPEEWANWMNRIEGTIDSQVVSVAQVHQDLSIMPQPGAGAQTGEQPGAGAQAGAQPGAGAQTGAQAPELLILMAQTLMPGKRQEYVSWLRDEMLPALRESDLMGVVSNEMTFGADARTWVFAVPVQSWSELDQPMPLYRSMGPEAAEQLMSRGESMVESGETIVLRNRPDLSAAGTQPGQQQQGQQQSQQSQQRLQ